MSAEVYEYGRLQSRNDLVLRPFNFCVIDEVDSILIDEARTPLIISGVPDGLLTRQFAFTRQSNCVMRSRVRVCSTCEALFGALVSCISNHSSRVSQDGVW